ncbi:hypothetical protein VPNG_00923 [Cytospora leucostoma]|uniref:Uncharacterized protein n=1 Tax=Cytospora leucostoma TaxID=1230097 RepID=A0A423XLU8_9PEZI|nr:hypothetical protein VPNG_00923 [Cytospora leucostoma]
MDIDRASFWARLPLILKAISEAQFVSVDLEMSGIAVGKGESREVSFLQQIYDDARTAAETFTVLQFGLTCMRWDPATEAYVTKTINVPVHPGVVGGDAISQQLARTVNRSVSFSTKTIAFLQEHGFSFADVFNKGVPYLSTTEAAQKEIINILQNKVQEEEDRIDVSQLPPQAKEFYSDVQSRMKEWTDKLIYDAQVKPLRIVNPHGGRLNHLQKRLIFQLVETDFKDYRAYSRAGSAYMEIMEVDVKEQRVPGRIKAQRKQAVVKQTGLRFLWDAICGRLFADKIDPDLVVGEDPAKIIQLRKDLKEYERRLRNQSPIFVGHNLLWDLCFLHTTFVGSLPESIDDFRAILRERLPRIVDTKYLFTRGGHEMLPDQNLAECFAAVKTEKFPVVRQDPLYSYLEPHPHQAGYDSYMTAIVFIKKSYQLSQAKQGLEFIAAEDSVEVLAPPRPGPALAMPPPHSRTPRSSSLSTQALRRTPAVPPLGKTSRSVSTGSLLDDDAAADLASYVALKPEVPKARTVEPSTAGSEPVGPVKVMDWGGVFWQKYGNKSRVGPFGLVFYTGKVPGERVF